MLAGTGQIPPATAVNYIPWALIGFIFNFVIRRRHFNWWAKYNCECWVSVVLLHCRSTLSPFPSLPCRRRAFGCTRLRNCDRHPYCFLRVRTIIISIPLTWVDGFYVLVSLQYPRRGTIGKGTIESWWGNTVYTQTADSKTLPLREVVAGEFFG